MRGSIGGVSGSGDSLERMLCVRFFSGEGMPMTATAAVAEAEEEA